jgi:hypothetical protein
LRKIRPNQPIWKGWAGVPYWNSDEAAALLAGWDPLEAGFLREGDEYSIKIERIKITIERVIEAGDLAGSPGRILPYDLVSWSVGLPIHSDRLFWAVVRHEHRDDPSPDVEAAEINSLRKEIARLKRQLATVEEKPSSVSTPNPTSPDVGDLGEKERITFQKMILGMALKKYNYRIGQRNGASEMISRNLEDVGIKLSDDTIRDKLGEASQSIPVNTDEALKPKSGNVVRSRM